MIRLMKLASQIRLKNRRDYHWFEFLPMKTSSFVQILCVTKHGLDEVISEYQFIEDGCTDVLPLWVILI